MYTVEQAKAELDRRMANGDPRAHACMVTYTAQCEAIDMEIAAKTNALNIEKYNVMRDELAEIGIDIPDICADMAEGLRVVSDEG